MINKHLDKNNLHHAYLIEGKQEKIVPEILEFLKGLGILTVGSPDFFHISIDSFKIEDARNLKSYATEKSFFSDLSTQAGKKIFIISANNFLLEAQNSLLKIFEEPIENTHFFLIVPDTNSLLKTFISRFYVIKAKPDLVSGVEDAEKFINMSLQKRLDFLKDLLPKKDEENEEEINAESNSSKALKFLNALEFVVHKKMLKGTFDTRFFEHIFKVREFLRLPGSSAKTLIESVALVVPIF
jgi:DNA polymerase-3 subunit delta'